MGAQLMKATVVNLTVDDMVSIAAYLASQTP
jgi:cytochrome c553